MRRLLLSATILLATGAFLVVAGGASNGSSAVGTYKIELDNAFGIVTGADFRVAGVRAGPIKSIDLDSKTLHALVTVQVTQKGFGSFHSDAFCQSRPQSLIGEYFIDCDPGRSGNVLKSGSTIPVTHTASTIPGDLVNNILRLPYRQRFSLIINELGAAVAGRSEDLQSALQRAVPALTETDNLLNLLANDSHTLQELTANSDAVVTALANNKVGVQRFITEANKNATITATQQTNLQATFNKLPAFLEQLRPAIAQLGAASDANTPVLANLNASSGQLHRLFTDLTPFAQSSLPAIRSLGQASVTGKAAVEAAGPTVQHLNQFSQPTPELAQNLSIVLRDLDSRSRAVEKDPRSPGGQGYTGLESLLQYVFNQTLSINVYGPFGHQLVTDAFLDPACTFYTSSDMLSLTLAKFGPSGRHCYAWLGPNQPGVNETDPTNPSACVPDPGGAPPGQAGPTTSACKLTSAAALQHITSAPLVTGTPSAAGDTSSNTSAGTGGVAPPSSGVGGGTAASGSSTPGATSNSQSAVAQGVSAVGGAAGAAASGSSSASGSSASGSSSASPGVSSGAQTQQLLNYLLAP